MSSLTAVAIIALIVYCMARAIRRTVEGIVYHLRLLKQLLHTVNIQRDEPPAPRLRLIKGGKK